MPEDGLHEQKPAGIPIKKAKRVFCIEHVISSIKSIFVSFLHLLYVTIAIKLSHFSCKIKLLLVLMHGDWALRWVFSKERKQG